MAQKPHTRRKFDTGLRKMVRTKVRYVEPSPERMAEIRHKREQILQLERLRIRLPIPAKNHELMQKNRRTPMIGRTQTKEAARRLARMA